MAAPYFCILSSDWPKWTYSSIHSSSMMPLLTNQPKTRSLWLWAWRDLTVTPTKCCTRSVSISWLSPLTILCMAQWVVCVVVVVGARTNRLRWYGDNTAHGGTSSRPVFFLNKYRLVGGLFHGRPKVAQDIYWLNSLLTALWVLSGLWTCR